ncbi:hypothetical protein CONLIGDRAFT_447613 [Coniochaeta ligniaria NRRL 30616]|uniref:Centromere protein X n=1 Tax=Coniochaeta ligniaria NRRL 30616 TaxID=1408157 RepID=A0A1J7J337_9PEZI|nr:hypothetical protein CONLIGDRAFT_447613 [Coniochaeta ligniaria NRRL 30616]
MPKQSAPSSKAAGKRASTAASSSRAATNTGNKRRATATATVTSDDDAPQVVDDEEEEDEDEDEQAKTIPPGLLTRLLHEFFAKEGTRVTKDANAAVARYMDVFVREAIARSVAEREGGGFLEVEDLEKVAPQLLLDM